MRGEGREQEGGGGAEAEGARAAENEARAVANASGGGPAKTVAYAGTLRGTLANLLWGTHSLAFGVSPESP